MQNLFNVFKIQAEQCWQTWDVEICKIGYEYDNSEKVGLLGLAEES